MARQTAEMDQGGSPRHLDRKIEAWDHREKEIKERAIRDARSSFSTVRDLLRSGVGPSSPSSKSEDK